MNLWILLIPLLSAAIGGVTVALGSRWMLQKVFQRDRVATALSLFLQELDADSELQKALDKIEWQNEIQGLLEKRLELLVLIFKQQIPMASMVLTPTLTEKLNLLATQEIIKIVPDLKRLLAEKLQNGFLKDTLATKMIGLDLHKFEQIYFPLLQKGAFLASLFGFSVGLLQLALFYYI